MKYCEALNNSLNIERDRIHFCYVVKQHMPSIPWNPDEEFPVERIRTVRDALVRELNRDISQPVAEYEEFGEHSGGAHPCQGCRQIVDIPDATKLPSTDQLHNYLHMQAFTYCNAQCVYCNLSKDAGRTPLNQGHDLDKAVYKAVNQLLDTGAVGNDCRVIFSSGEPTISKLGMLTLNRLVDMGQDILVNTNAITFSPEIEQALQAGNTSIQISLDSGNREDYLKIKGVDRFDKVAENIDRYLAACKGNSSCWLKYIVFSQTNSKKAMDSFVNFCAAHKTRNITVNVNYNEGEAVSSNARGKSIDINQEEIADLKTIKAFGYIASRLELQGHCVHKEFAHLTTNEQNLAKREYALTVMKAINYKSSDLESCINAVIAGMEMASMPLDSTCLKDNMVCIIRKAAEHAKGIALFGAGAHAQWIAQIMGELDLYPVIIIDNNPTNQTKFNFPVVTPNKISNYAIDTVIIASTAYHLQIHSQLLEMTEFANLTIINPYLDLP